jgi:uncharacterized membrane protein
MPKSMTSPLTTTGRALFALAILGFGIQYAIYGQLRDGLPMFPAWTPHGHIIAYAMAAILIAAGLALLAAWRVVATSLALGLLLLFISILYLGHLQDVLHDGGVRSLFFEALSFASAVLILHGLATGSASKYSLMPGRILFAFAMIVFGAQHFMYPKFIATLVPGWIPQHHFWVIFTGVALIAAGVAIATTIADKAASFCLFALFFGWLVLLHFPRILHALHNADEWSSGFVVLGLSGASLLVAASSHSVKR